MLALLGMVGMLPSELLQLRRRHVLPGNRLAVPRSRSHELVIVDLPPAVTLVLERFMVQHAERFPMGGTDALLFPLDIRSLRRTFDYYARVVGLGDDVTLYSLRHTAAARVLEAADGDRGASRLFGAETLRRHRRALRARRRREFEQQTGS